jgi:hypothetical protein
MHINISAVVVQLVPYGQCGSCLNTDTSIVHRLICEEFGSGGRLNLKNFVFCVLYLVFCFIFLKVHCFCVRLKVTLS